MLLPTYDVFDETRYFDPAQKVSVFTFKGERLGISICEDAWNHADLWTRQLYERDPMTELAEQGATLFINIAASPFHVGKGNLRASLAAQPCPPAQDPFPLCQSDRRQRRPDFRRQQHVFRRQGVSARHASGVCRIEFTVDTGSRGNRSRFLTLIPSARSIRRSCSASAIIPGSAVFPGRLSGFPAEWIRR